MKVTRFVFALLVVAMVGTGAYAFHDGGVADCSGCHTMHNSENGVAMNGSDVDVDHNPIDGLPVGEGYPDLLLFPSKTDVCLRCHIGGGSYHIWSDDPLTPNATTANRGGGDFVFLQEDNINDGHGGASEPILGHAAGHSVVSGIKGTVADPVLSMSPGGAYPASDLHCTSCHDPHGTSAFRLTYMVGQTTVSDTGHAINWDATIDADGISLFGPGESNGNHNAYKDGYSEWCGNCHGLFHDAASNLIHPAGSDLDTWQVQVYNAYQGSENCANFPPGVGTPCGNGTFASAYLHTVPIEDAGMTTSTVTGATDGTSKVVCVSCHRAHATSAPNAGRWDFNVTGLAEDGHESSSYPIPNPYNEFQRSLCNKCHAQDEYDAVVDFTP